MDVLPDLPVLSEEDQRLIQEYRQLHRSWIQADHSFYGTLPNTPLTLLADKY